MSLKPSNPGCPQQRPRAVALMGMAALLALGLLGCSAPAPRHGPSEAGQQATAPRQASLAPNPKDYRKDAARHLYVQHKDRVFQGRLPPMLYAIGVLHVDIDRQGRVQRLEWRRKPQHAPEVVADIERMVRAAAPFPAPMRLGQVTYTDVWLWDKSGRFQLDTLTEGQD